MSNLCTKNSQKNQVYIHMTSCMHIGCLNYFNGFCFISLSLFFLLSIAVLFLSLPEDAFQLFTCSTVLFSGVCAFPL